MSSSAVQPSRLSPRLAQLGSALERARLSVVPRGRTQAKRLPFVVLVSAILIGGVVGLLMFNTSMQQAAFTQARLQQQQTALAARQQALAMRLQALNNPQHIAAEAQRMHMVIPDSAALLSVPSGKVQGVPTPATNANTPPVWSANPAPHYRTRVVHAAQ
jgi:type II secretory pathway pseudopilin PulG